MQVEGEGALCCGCKLGGIDRGPQGLHVEREGEGGEEGEAEEQGLRPEPWVDERAIC